MMIIIVTNVFIGCIAVLLPTIFYYYSLGRKSGQQNHCGGGGDENLDAADCAICLSEISTAETFRVLPTCHHGFHAECIESWLRFHSTCPLCRANVPCCRLPKSKSQSGGLMIFSCSRFCLLSLLWSCVRNNYYCNRMEIISFDDYELAITEVCVPVAYIS